MFGDFREVKIFVKPGATDFRKLTYGGLVILASEFMKKEAMSGNLFPFYNKSRNRVKALYWDMNGFCLWIKRLEEDKFPLRNLHETINTCSHYSAYPHRLRNGDKNRRPERGYPGESAEAVKQNGARILCAPDLDR